MTREATYAFQEQKRHSRLSDEMFTTFQHHEPKPGKDEPLAKRCAYCDQRLPQTRTTVISMFCGGIHRLVMAVCMIVGAILRLARLVLAASFCVLGSLGTFFRSLGVLIAHPDDKRFFANLE